MDNEKEQYNPYDTDSVDHVWYEDESTVQNHAAPPPPKPQKTQKSKLPKLPGLKETMLGNRLINHRSFRTVRNYTHDARANCALRGALRAARWHWRFAQSPSTGASPCADSIGYPITAHGAETTRR